MSGPCELHRVTLARDLFIISRCLATRGTRARALLPQLLIPRTLRCSVRTGFHDGRQQPGRPGYAVLGRPDPWVPGADGQAGALCRVT